jgi:phosphoglycolate phosphatase
VSYETVLLDLDGTLVDSAPGIVQTIAHTLRTLDYPVPPVGELLRWVGPPLPESFTLLGGVPKNRVDEALAIYRERYVDVGAYDSKLFDGVGALLRDLKERGTTLALATSKPHTPAVLMLEHFTLAHHFAVIATAWDDETRGEKPLIVGDALEELAKKGHSVESIVMVGDRIHDVDGAKEHGLPSIIVGWGYGTGAEWGHADYVAHTPRQLRTLLGLPAPRDFS